MRRLPRRTASTSRPSPTSSRSRRSSLVQSREAACHCGKLRVTAEGEPVRISMCHCRACQRRTGSAFGMQARFPRERVQIEGRSCEYVRVADVSGEERRFHFCPDCGGTVYYLLPAMPDIVAVTVGSFADP